MRFPLDVVIDTKDPGLVVIKLRGDYKEIQPYLQNEFNKALNNLQYKQVIDLSEIQNITKQGIHDIFEQLRRLSERKGNLVLLKPSKDFNKTLESLEARGLFEIVQTKKEAKNILNNKPLKKITPYIRLHKRNITASGNGLTLNDVANISHRALLYDTSEGGLGIVYVGENCPQLYMEYTVILDDKPGVCSKKSAMVSWVNCLCDKLFRIGLTYKGR